MNSLFNSSHSTSTNENKNTLELLNKALQFSFHSKNSPRSSSEAPLLIIPSLASSDSDFHYGATNILSCLRSEVLAWSCSIDSQNNASSSSSKNIASVFWSLIVAHTSSFENGKHFDSSYAWLIPFIASCVFKLEDGGGGGAGNHNDWSSSSLSFSSRQIRAAIQDQVISKMFFCNASSSQQQLPIQTVLISSEIFAQRFIIPPQKSLSEENDEWICERISSAPTRWIGLAFNFLKCNLLDRFLRQHERDGDSVLWQLSTTIIQALISVWVPSRGIFVDRIKVLTCCASSQNSESTVAASKLIQGIPLPWELGIESKIVFQRRWNKIKINQRNEQKESEAEAILCRAICFSCSLDFSDQSEEQEQEAEETENDNEDDEDILIKFLTKNNIALLICQRAIPSRLKTKLAKLAGVISIDRLGISHFPTVIQVLRNPAAIHRFDRELFLDETSDDDGDEDEEEDNDERNAMKSRCIAHNVRLWRTFEMKNEKLFLGVPDPEHPTSSSSVVTSPSIVSISIISSSNNNANLVTESIARSCVKHVSQILVDDVVMRRRRTNESKISSTDNSSAIFPRQVVSSILGNMIRYIESNKNNSKSNAIDLLKFIKKELDGKVDDASDGLKTRTWTTRENKESPPCIRVATIRDALYAGFDLAQQLISISTCV